MRKNQKLAAIAGLLLLCAAGYFGWHFLAVHYHHYRMMGAYRSAQKLGPYEPNHGRLMTAYEEHRSALMRLGYYAKRQFYFNHLSVRSESFQDLLRQLPERFPSAIGKIEPHGYIYGEPPFMVVWVHPADAKLIEAFVVAQDD